MASKTNDVAGDGTTTATVLTRFLFSEGCKSVEAGMNPMDVRRGINKVGPRVGVLLPVRLLCPYQVFGVFVRSHGYKPPHFFMLQAVEAVVESLQSRTKVVESKEEIEQVATISGTMAGVC